MGEIEREILGIGSYVCLSMPSAGVYIELGRGHYEAFSFYSQNIQRAREEKPYSDVYSEVV